MLPMIRSSRRTLRPSALFGNVLRVQGLALKCIYCRAELEASTHSSHVFPRCLGGRLESPRICCSDCNSEIGVIEDGLYDKLLEPSAAVGALTGRNRKVSVTIEDGSHRYDFHAGSGEPQVAPPKFDPEKRSMSIPLPAGTTNQASLLAHWLCKSGKQPSDLTIEDDPSHEFEWRTLCREMKFVIDRPDFRVFAKISIELLEHQRPNAAREYRLDRTKRFIRYDEGRIAYKADRYSLGSGLIDEAELFEFAHTAEIWTNGSCLFSRIMLFRDMIFTAPLCTDWPGPTVAVAYALNPQEPTMKIVRTSDADGPNLSMHTEERMIETMARFTERFEAASKRINSNLPVAEQEPAPTLAELLPLVEEEYEKIVFRRGPAKKK